MITQKYLKEVLDYNPETGIFYRRIRKAKNLQIGTIAGGRNKVGYTTLSIDYKRYYAHRLAWLYVYSEIPEKHIDHVDGNRSNNKISNLRLCTRSENQRNKSKHSNNTSGYKGVSWDKRCGKWVASGLINRRQHFLGYYLTPEEASEAYIKFAKEQHKEFYCER